MRPSEVLDRAADLITPEGAWTQGEWARGKRRRRVEPTSPKATCWCVDGAIIRAGDEQEARSAAYDFATDAVGTQLIVWNDTPGRTQAEVVAALRKASELARSEGQ